MLSIYLIKRDGVLVAMAPTRIEAEITLTQQALREPTVCWSIEEYQSVEPTLVPEA